MKSLSSTISSLLSNPFVKAVVGPIVAGFVRRQIRAAIPVVLKNLDLNLPHLLQDQGQAALEAFVRDELKALTGLSIRSTDIEEVFRLFDPRITAERLRKG